MSNPTRPPPRPAPAPAKAPAAPAAPERKGLSLKGFVDVHFRIGFEVENCRMKMDQYRELQNLWILGGEDVILRAQYDKSEVQIVLRGADGGRFRVKDPDPTKKYPEYMVISVELLREKMLEKAGLDAPTGEESEVEESASEGENGHAASP